MAKPVRNALTCLAVQPGEDAALITETTTDPLVVEAFAYGLRSEGATVTILKTKTNLAGGMYTVKLPRPAEEAFLASDIAIALTKYPTFHTSSGDRFQLGQEEGWSTGDSEKLRYNVRFMDLCGMATTECLLTAGAFPVHVAWRIMKKVVDRMKTGSTIRYVNRRGMDFSAKVRPSAKVDPYGPRVRPMKKGEFLPWPYGAWVNMEPDHSEGFFVWDGFVPFGYCESAVKFRVSEGYVKGIEGNSEAEFLKAYLAGIENAMFLCEIGIGINPWARRVVKTDQGIHEMTRKAGNGLIAIGDGVTIRSKSHIDGVLVDPSVYVDGELLVDKGRLLLFDDPELRETARQYGDPERVLSTTGYLYL